jgi:hypothetical protein
LNIGRKAFSVGMSAALAASLLTAIAVPAALASITQTSAGNVAQGTTSAGTATFLFTENSAAALVTTGTMTVTITDSATGNTVTWAGTPVVSAPDSLGASVSLLGNALNIKITGHDDLNVETIAISGLKVKAASNAAPGAVIATLSGSAAVYGAFVGGTVTATGRLAQAYGSGTTSFIVANDVGSCPFSGTNNVTVGSEVLTGIAVSAVNTPVAGQQTITSAASTASHLANEVVSQTVPNCNTTALASPANVVTAAAVSYDGPYTVYPGESNSSAGNIYLAEPATPAGFLAGGTVITYTIATAGVVFSGLPTATVSNQAGHATIGSPTLSADRKSVSVSIGTAGTTASVVTLSNINYDVASNVAGGTFIDVNVTLSGGLIVTGNPAENAVVFRGITATAPMPTVYIGENAQATGLVTMTEQAAGFFQSGTGSNNVIAVCTTAVNYSFTFAPWAKVTSGDLRLRDGSTASATNIVQGAFDGYNCYTWTVWTGSTTASTIVIGNSTFSSGPLINVDTDQAPGVVAMKIYSGNGSNYTSGQIATVGFAVAAYRNQVAVVALSQPTIPAGAKTKAGAIQISETANGQLKRWEDICLEVLPRSSTTNPDIYMQGLNTADLPVVTATGGLVVGPVEMSSESCSQRYNEGFPPVTPSGTHMLSFDFDVYQQSTAGNGQLTIDNINLITTADAPNGPVLFNVFGYGGSPTNLEFQATVSNAKIGTIAPIAIRAASAVGVPPNQGPWSTSTKVVAAKKYVTWQFNGGSQLAGKHVDIWVATKNAAGGWGPFVKLTSRVANASGVATFSWRASATWISVRAMYAGDPSVAASWSPALQARYLK